MPDASLPAALQLGSGVLILATASFMVAAHSILISRAASTAREPTPPATPWLAAGYLALWLGIALACADAANFAQPRPLIRQLVAAIVAFAPLFLATALLFRSRTLRALNSSMKPEWLIRLQVYRVAGIMFLLPFLAYGIVPAGFAWPAAVGDLLTGFAAPFVGAAVARRRPGSFTWAVAWNLFGILDLVVAPAAAILSNAQVFSYYPLALIPLFLGPPMGILTHVCSLRNLATTRDAQAARPAPAATEALGTA